MAEVKLFRTFSSPFALRIVWTLKLKRIEFYTVMEDFPHKSALLLKYNPVHKKVPVFVHNGKPISESLVILEYIEETWKETPLFPEDPTERVTARFWAKFGDEKVKICNFLPYNLLKDIRTKIPWKILKTLKRTTETQFF